ncbi:MAG: M48 family metallopeptidase [Deltaproteobacteria bacterium]|nr:M48 family metallopeptidase [Deltaproteobacteria bacterium]
MMSTIELGDIEVNVIRKDIKNVHLSVYPPNGAVRMSAPKHMKLDTLRVFAISKLEWIKQERRKLREQEREAPREFLDRESHFVWGERRLLKIEEADAPAQATVRGKQLFLQVRPGTDDERRQAIIAKWYRDQVRQAAPALIAKWERKIGVQVSRVFVQKMKTRWGSCNPQSRNIRLNSELAKKPPGCLEYIVVHELVHLLEPTHSARFQRLMDQFMPHWRSWRDELNRAPLAHEQWTY